MSLGEERIEKDFERSLFSFVEKGWVNKRRFNNVSIPSGSALILEDTLLSDVDAYWFGWLKSNQDVSILMQTPNDDTASIPYADVGTVVTLASLGSTWSNLVKPGDLDWTADEPDSMEIYPTNDRIRLLVHNASGSTATVTVDLNLGRQR